MNLNIHVSIYNKNKTFSYDLFSNQINKISCIQKPYGFTAEIEFILFDDSITDDFLNIFYSNESVFLNYRIKDEFFYNAIIVKKEILQITKLFRKYKFTINDVAKGLLSDLFLQKTYKDDSIKNIVTQNISEIIELDINSEFFSENKDVINLHSFSFYDFIIYICRLYNHCFLYHYHNGKYEITESFSANKDIKSVILKDEIINYSNFNIDNNENNLSIYFNSNNNYFDIEKRISLENASLDLENNQMFIKQLQATTCCYEIINLNKNSEYHYENNMESDFIIDGYKYYVEYTDKLKISLPELKNNKYSFEIVGEINVGDKNQEIKKYNLIEKEDGVYCSVIIPDYNVSIPAKFTPCLNSNFGFIPPYNKQRVMLRLILFSADIIGYLDFRITNKADFDSSNNILDLGFSNDLTSKISSSLNNEKSILEISQGSKDLKNQIKMSDEGLSITLEYE